MLIDEYMIVILIELTQFKDSHVQRRSRVLCANISKNVTSKTRI